MSPSAPAAIDDAVLTPGERLTVFLLWLVLSGAPSLVFWVFTDYFGYFYSPFFWLIVAGFSQPFMARVLGRVGAFTALPPDPNTLSHLHPELARLAHEAAAIRDELALHGLDPAMERAFILLTDVDRLPAELRASLGPGLTALAVLRELIDLRTRPGRPRLRERQQSDRMANALTAFTAALAEPASTGFR